MKYSIFISAIVLFFCSCSNDSGSELAVFMATKNSLEKSSQALKYVTDNIRKELNYRLTDPKTAEHAAIWEPKASKVSELTTHFFQYIEKLKLELLNEAGYSVSDEASVFKSNNDEAVVKIFFQKNRGEELLKELNSYITSVDSVDETMKLEFADFKKETYEYLTKKDNQRSFSKTYFNQSSTGAALAMLAKFENDIRNTENKLVTYCYYHTFPLTHNYEVFRVLVAQSSNYVKAGDNIEITAGVGSFSAASQPKVTIDGKVILANENGILVYKFKTPSKAGKYTKPVKMEYTKPDGTREEMIKKIEYTVIDPNQTPNKKKPESR